MRIHLCLWIFLLTQVHYLLRVESRGFGGFRGGSFRGGSFRGGSFRGGSFRGSGIIKAGGSRAKGQRGSFRPRTIPSFASRHTLYVRNGGLAGGRTASWNGFGLGLGSGLLIGYGTGLLVRPVGLAFPFRYRSPIQSRPKELESLACFFANSTAFISSEFIVGNIVMTETKELCPSSDHVCLGSVTIIQSNLTANDNETVVLYQVQVEKRCISLAELNETFSEEIETNNGTLLNCWTSDLASLENDQNLTSFTNASVGNDEMEIPLQLLANSKIEANDINSISLSYQSETCYCSSHLCNVAQSQTPNLFLMLLVLISVHRREY